MAIAVTCNHCGVRLRFKSEYQGRTAKCNACQQSIIVQGETIPDHDVFISYSSKDKLVADAVCAAMEGKRIRCWLAPRDILPGKPWAGAILDAIEDARIMVLIFSANANASPQVIREVDCAVTRNVIIIPFRIEAAEMSKEMQYYIAAAHWLDAMTGPMDQHIARLIATVRRLLSDHESPTSHRIQSIQPRGKKSRGWMIGPIAAMVLLAIGAGVWLMKHPRAITQAMPVASTTAPATPNLIDSTGVVDLLATLQLPDDALNDSWTRTSDGIRCDPQDNGIARLRFRYHPHGEYDFSVTFARQSGERLVGQVLSYGGKSFAWVMGRNFNRYDGFEMLDGSLVPVNRSTTEVRPALVNGQKHTSVVKVRKDSVSAYLDGKLICRVETDYSDVALPKLDEVGTGLLGLVSNDQTIFYAASITPVSDELPMAPVASQKPASTTRPQPVPSTPQGQQWVDLLTVVDPAKDAESGSWALADGNLTGRTTPGMPTAGARIDFPYVPTLEYDFRVSFICADSDAGVNLICRGGDHQFSWRMPGGNNAVCFFPVAGALRRDSTGKSIPNQWLYPGRRQIALVKVRKDGVEAYIDDKLVCQFKTDFSNLMLGRGLPANRRTTLGLQAGAGAVTFESIQVLEVNGKGELLR